MACAESLSIEYWVLVTAGMGPKVRRPSAGSYPVTARTVLSLPGMTHIGRKTEGTVTNCSLDVQKRLKTVQEL